MVNIASLEGIMKTAYIWAVVAVVLLLAGAIVYGRKKWNDDVMSLDHTKCFLGWASFMILLHHCSQMTSTAKDPCFKRPGLGVFGSVGYLMVAVFFFCSGYTGGYEGSDRWT